MDASLNWSISLGRLFEQKIGANPIRGEPPWTLTSNSSNSRLNRPFRTLDNGDFTLRGTKNRLFRNPRFAHAVLFANQPSALISL